MYRSYYLKIIQVVMQRTELVLKCQKSIINFNNFFRCSSCCFTAFYILSHFLLLLYSLLLPVHGYMWAFERACTMHLFQLSHCRTVSMRFRVHQQIETGNSSSYLP